MNSEWPTVTLKEITSVLGDGLHGTPKYDEQGEYYFINGNNLSNGRIVITDKTKRSPASEYEKHKKDLNDRTILVSINGTLGNIALYDGEQVFLGKSACYFNVKPDVDKLYIRYVLENRDFQDYIHNLATGSTIKNVSLKLMREFSFKLPPLNLQKKISEILGELDSKIQLNHQINQTLEQMAQAIFKSWFVDFEPVKAKIAALAAGGSDEDALLAAMRVIAGDAQSSADAAGDRMPGAAKGDKLTRLQAERPEQYAELRTTAELFPSAMQDSELGEIPEGWNVSQIGDEVTVVGGGTPSTKNPDFWENGEINWTSPKDLSNLSDKVLIETERKVTEAGLAKISSGLLPVDTVLMSSRAPVGYLALAKIPVAVNQGYIAMKCEKALSPEFVIQWCAANMDEIKSRASGTTFAEISKKNFKIIPVVMPTESLISIYSKQASSLYEAIESNVRESDTLAKLRDSLLPKLLSGELSVSDEEEQLAAAAEPANV